MELAGRQKGRSHAFATLARPPYQVGQITLLSARAAAFTGQITFLAPIPAARCSRSMLGALVWPRVIC